MSGESVTGEWSAEKISEHMAESIRRLRPILESVFSTLPEEERRYYLELMDMVEKKKIPTWNWMTYFYLHSALTSKALSIIKEKGGEEG